MKKIGVFGILIGGLQFSIWSHATTPLYTVEVLVEGAVAPIEGRQLIPGWCEQEGDIAPDGTECTDAGARFVRSTVALVKGNGVEIVVDPGFVAKADQYYLRNRLKRVGGQGQKVFTFISHHHPDHTINAALVANRKKLPRHSPTVVDFWASYRDDFWEDHSDNYEISEGAEVMRTPGHTDEDASLVLWNARLADWDDDQKGTLVFTHVWWFAVTDENDNVLRDEQGDPILFPTEDPIGEDSEALEASRRKVICIADYIIPGHGGGFFNPFEDREEYCDDDDEDDG